MNSNVEGNLHTATLKLWNFSQDIQNWEILQSQWHWQKVGDPFLMFMNVKIRNISNNLNEMSLTLFWSTLLMFRYPSAFFVVTRSHPPRIGGLGAKWRSEAGLWQGPGLRLWLRAAEDTEDTQLTVIKTPSSNIQELWVPVSSLHWRRCILSLSLYSDFEVSSLNCIALHCIDSWRYASCWCWRQDTFRIFLSVRIWCGHKSASAFGQCSAV